MLAVVASASEDWWVQQRTARRQLPGFGRQASGLGRELTSPRRYRTAALIALVVLLLVAAVVAAMLYSRGLLSSRNP